MSCLLSLATVAIAFASALRDQAAVPTACCGSAVIVALTLC
jgi:hypothetical protein